jgi:hypothetical protein
VNGSSVGGQIAAADAGGPGTLTSRVHCVRPSTQLTRSLRHYLAQELR